MLKTFLFLAAGMWGGGLLLAQEPGPSSDPGAWSTRLHRFAAPTMAAPGQDTPVLQPTLPAAAASTAEIMRYLRESTEVARHYFETFTAEPLPKGFLAAFDPARQTLAVRAPNATQEAIARSAQLTEERNPAYLSFNTHIVEADDAQVRGIMKEAVRGSNHRILWERMQALISQGTAREVSTVHLDTRSGQRASAGQGLLRSYATGFALRTSGLPEVAHGERHIGTTFEVDPVLRTDASMIDVSFSLTHDYAPPVNRLVHVGSTGPQRIDSLVTDFRFGEVTTGISLYAGTARLLGVWTPEGVNEPERAGHLQAAFLTADVVRVQPALNQRVLQLLQKYGEQVMPTPAASPPSAPNSSVSASNGMEVRHFRVPPDFLSVGSGGSGENLDPFAKQPPQAPADKKHLTAVEILQGAGISFPEGSSAVFDAASSELIVKNLPENLKWVEAFVSPICCARTPQTIAFSLHIIQADAKTLRDLAAQASLESDHGTAFKTLEDAAAQGRAKFIHSAWFESRSGQRARLESGTHYMTVSPLEQGQSKAAPPAPAGDGPAKNLSAAPAASLSAKHETTNVGLDFEVDPVIGPDGVLVDLSFALSYHYALPQIQNEPASEDAAALRAAIPVTDFHEAKILTATTLQSGSTRLLGLWKPDDKPGAQNVEVLQAAFLRVDVLRREEPPAKR